MASTSEFSSPLPLSEAQISENIKKPTLTSSNNSNEVNYLSSFDNFSISDDFRVDIENKLNIFKLLLKKNSTENGFEGLVMVDAIQRLGIEHYFKQEIDEILQNHYSKPNTYDHNNLQEVSVRFRLLRQEGYYVPAQEVFGIFKDKEGKFKEEISCDIKGLMGLYEASHLCIEGEDILEEGGDFSYKILNSCLIRNNVGFNEAKEVENTLKYPYYKSLAKFMAKSFSTDLQETNGWMNELQQLAKLSFIMVQSQHQHEILKILKWWKDVGLSKELKFARNQPLKWYIWSMTALTDPSLSQQRLDLIKPISFVYIIDDIFDVYGSPSDLTLFAEVVDRWDVCSTKELPNYMTICFNALNDITNEISSKVYKEFGWNPVDALRKAWANLCNAFLVEARWFASGELPNPEDYLKNGIVSSGVHVVLVHLFFLLGHGLTKENVEFINNNPGIISSTAKILRLWDDLGSAKDENQDGFDGSYVECYLKEHQELSLESARKHVRRMITDTWKQLSKESLFQNQISPTFEKACLNVARMVPLMYSYDENCCLPMLQELTRYLLSGNLETC